jgi:hypothetical protein
MAGCKDGRAGVKAARDGRAGLLRAGGVRYQHGMTKRRSDTEAGSPAGGDAAAKPGRPREERLSAALRANLARRKVQARERKRYGDKAAEAGQVTHDSAGFVEDKRTR